MYEQLTAKDIDRAAESLMKRDNDAREMVATVDRLGKVLSQSKAYHSALTLTQLAALVANTPEAAMDTLASIMFEIGYAVAKAEVAVPEGVTVQ